MTESTSPAGGPGQPPATVGAGALRVSHADRDQVAELLRVAAGDGRLSADELDERLERALTALTYAELAVLTADLPAGPGAALAPAAPGIVPVTPKDLVRIHVHGSAASREGRWVVPKEMDITVRGGAVALDFTEAVITGPLLRITATVKGGSLVLITRPGVTVDTDDITNRGGSIALAPPRDSDRGTPEVLRVEIAGSVHGGSIAARPPRPPRPPRRTFWQWLRRAPRPPAIGA